MRTFGDPLTWRRAAVGRFMDTVADGNNPMSATRPEGTLEGWVAPSVSAEQSSSLIIASLMLPDNLELAQTATCHTCVVGD